MAHKWGLKIREKNGRDELSPLMWRPPQERFEDCLRCHNIVWPWLRPEEKRIARSKWMKAMVETMIDQPEFDWRKTFDKFLLEIKSIKYWDKGRKNPEPGEYERMDVSSEMIAVMVAYNRHRALNQIAQSFPYWVNKKQETLQLIELLLTRGSLWDHERATYLKQREDYILKLSVKAVSYLNMRVQDIIRLMTMAKVWNVYFQSMGIFSIRDIRPDHFDGFEAWRTNYRLGGDKEKRIRRKPIKNELNYIRNVFKFAMSHDLIEKNPTLEIKLSVAKKWDGAGKEICEPDPTNRPMELAKLWALFKALPKHYHSMEVHNLADKKRKDAVRLNWLSLVFLMLVGCRPKELREWNVVDGRLAFIGGKTKNAHRSLPISPTLAAVLRDPIMKKNFEVARVDNRLTNFMNTHYGKGSNIYRLRHSVATAFLVMGSMSLAEIAYWMGHASTVITQRLYGNMTSYLKAGGKAAVEEFWSWINNDYFKEFSLDEPKNIQDSLLPPFNLEAVMTGDLIMNPDKTFRWKKATEESAPDADEDSFGSVDGIKIVEFRGNMGRKPVEPGFGIHLDEIDDEAKDGEEEDDQEEPGFPDVG